MAFVGKWIQQGQFDNMEGLLDAVGVVEPNMRKMIVNLKIELEISQSGEQMDFKMIAPHQTRSISFKNGDEVDQVSFIGRPVKSLITMQGNKMTEITRDPANENENTRISRVVNGDIMDVTLEAKGVVAQVHYHRI